MLREIGLWIEFPIGVLEKAIAFANAMAWYLLHFLLDCATAAARALLVHFKDASGKLAILVPITEHIVCPIRRRPIQHKPSRRKGRVRRSHYNYILQPLTVNSIHNPPIHLLLQKVVREYHTLHPVLHKRKPGVKFPMYRLPCSIRHDYGP